MSQKKKQYPKPESQKSPANAAKPPSLPLTKRLSFSDFKVQAAILGLIVFAVYFNTFFNEYALDDDILIVKNEYVQEGFSGLPKIFTTDAYDSYYRHLNNTYQLSGGRYRPLSIATFAIEQQFFGALPPEEADSFVTHTVISALNEPQEKEMLHNMHIRHVVNVLLYIISVIVLLYFLRTIIFKKEPAIAFLAALLFTILPIHTEVVANVKSRDEIMSLLFMCLTLIFAYKYEEQKNKKLWLLLGMLCYFLTFLSKEYAISLVFLLPLMFYLFKNYSISRSLGAVLPYLLVVAGYFFIRAYIATQMAEQNTGGQVTLLEGLSSLFSKTGVSGKDVLADPYCFATPVQKLATEIATSLSYLRLLIFPHPLSADYSYNTIPYKDFSNLLVWLSVLVHGALIALMIMFFRIRHVLCFAIAFYLLHLLLINNMIFNTAGTMGERLIYHSSVGFAIVVAYIIYRGYQQIKPASFAKTSLITAKTSLITLMSVIVILCAIKTIARNADWKNNTTLFLHDVKVVPNSVLANENAAASFNSLAAHEKDEKQKTTYLQKALAHFNKVIALDSIFVAAHYNRAISYYQLGMYDSSLADLNKVKELFPTYPGLKEVRAILADHYVKSGANNYAKYGNFPGAIAEFKKGLLVDSTNADLWYNIGVASYSNNQYNDAVFAFKKTLQFNPDFKHAQQNLQVAMSKLQANPSTTQK